MSDLLLANVFAVGGHNHAQAGDAHFRGGLGQKDRGFHEDPKRMANGASLPVMICPFHGVPATSE